MASLEKNGRSNIDEQSLSAAHDVDYIVDLEDTSHSLGGEGDGAGGHEERLHNVFLQDVGDCALSHVYPSCFFSLSVPERAESCYMSNVHSAQGSNLFLNSVTVEIGLSPAFSANV